MSWSPPVWRPSALAGAGLLLALSLSGCSGGRPQPEEPDADPRAADAQADDQARASVEKLTQISKAFTSLYPQMLAGYVGADGQLILSWRVAVLPSLGLDDLHKKFKLDEPWDSPHNRRLIDQMPDVYRPVRGQAKPGHTFYQGFSGRDALFPTPRGPRPPGFDPRVRPQGGQNWPWLVQRMATDGTTNTLLVVEAREAIPWTRPDDLAYDAGRPLPPLGGMFDGDFHALFMDGKVRRIPGSAPEALVRAMITHSAGDVVDLSLIGLRDPRKEAFEGRLYEDATGEEWAQRAAAADPATRLKAATALGQLREPSEVVEATLRKLLEDEHPHVRTEAAFSSSQHGLHADLVIPLVIQYLEKDITRVPSRDSGGKGGPPSSSWYPAGALAGYGKRAVPALTDALPRLAAARRSTDQAIDALGQIGPDAHPAAEALARFVTEPGPRGDFPAARALGRIGPKAKAAVPALTTALAESPPSRPGFSAIRRLELAAALIRIDRDHPAALESLKACQKDPNDRNGWLRAAAAFALAQRDPKDPEGLPLLIDMLGKGTTPERAGWSVPETAQLAEYLGRLGPAAKSALPELRKCYPRPQSGWQGSDGAILAAMTRIDPDATGPLLTKWIRTNDGSDRFGALAVVRALGDSAVNSPAALTILREIVGDQRISDQTRREALRAVEKATGKRWVFGR